MSQDHKETPEIPVYLGEPVTYTRDELEEKAHNFLKRNHRKDYRAMSQQERNEWAQQKAEAAERYAGNLMETGLDSKDAWNRAIRSAILESESE